ncbi:MAG: response regulator transcription factor [Agriterribacter sp.]
MTVEFFRKNRLVFLYGLLLSALLFLLKWLELKFVIISHSLEVYIGAIAVIFTVLGIWLSRKLTKTRIEIIEKEVYIERETSVVPDPNEILRLGLTKREMEVLALMAEGSSNEEIGEKLYLSLHTIKTHASRIFEKMDVKRRTQAVDKAKRLRLIP